MSKWLSKILYLYVEEEEATLLKELSDTRIRHR